MPSAPTFLALVHFTMTMSGRCAVGRLGRRARARRSLFPLFSPFSAPSPIPPPSPPETRESETLLPCRVSLDSLKARCTVGALLSVWKLKAGHFLKGRH